MVSEATAQQQQQQQQQPQEQEQQQPQEQANPAATDGENEVPLAKPVIPETYRLEFDEVVQAPRPFEVPKQPYYLHHWTGRVTCVARRECSGGINGINGKKSGSLPNNDRIVFYVQGVPGIYRTRALFVAQRRERGGRYDIYNIYNNNNLKDKFFFERDGKNKTDETNGSSRSNSSNSNDNISEERYAGRITTRKNAHKGHYHCTLFRGPIAAETEVSSTIYNRASLRYPVVDGSPDRIAYSVIRVDPATNRLLHHQQVATPEKPVTSIEQAVKSNLPTDIHNIKEDHKDLQVFQSKRRFTDRRGNHVHDDTTSFLHRFGRRAQLSSKKNLQLMDVNSGKVVLQVARWDATEFTVDFLPPYTPFDAFGFALAQLECNH